jgi:hypothetical protein
MSDFGSWRIEAVKTRVKIQYGGRSVGLKYMIVVAKADIFGRHQLNWWRILSSDRAG